MKPSRMGFSKHRIGGAGFARGGWPCRGVAVLGAGLLLVTGGFMVVRGSPEVEGGRFEGVPGTVIDHRAQSTGLYIGSPSLTILSDGVYLAAHDLFGPKSKEFECPVTVIHRSADRGLTWVEVARVQCGFWSSLFAHRGAAYLMGTDKHHGRIVLRRSTDGGGTWTEPVDARTGLLTADGEYHTAPVPVIEHGGRLWRAFEDAMGGTQWGRRYRAFMMSAPVEADLLDASSWTFSNRLARDAEWLGGEFNAWLEGNAVVTADGRVMNILRVDTPGFPEKAAMIEISPDGKRATFDPATGFIDFPGGAKKFTIRFDARSGRYWSLATVAAERHRGVGKPAGIRNMLGLVCSADLREWEIRCILLYHPDVAKHGFQYPDWQFEGEDIIAAVRTAYDDGMGGAHNNHDANFLTFHRIENFRVLTPADSVEMGGLGAQAASGNGEADSAVEFQGKTYENGDIFADSWVGTDALGRVVPGFEECGPVKDDKWVGIFYWTWHVAGRGGPNDNTKILAGEADGQVEWPANRAPHHWGEPELGYYLMTDPFVIRKHASMLADAGVDVVLFDTTNPPFTWRAEYEALCREYEAMREEGARTPGIGFIAPFGDPRPVTDQLWRDLYQPGLWSDLWFRWEGKPLLLANKEFIRDEAMLEFFTFRRPMPDYWVGPSGPEQWSWLEVHPQHVFRDRAGEAEQMSVGVAQNALPGTPGPAPMSHKAGAMGRSWHNGGKDERPGAVEWGLNFDEQWSRAIEVSPRFIFVTGWNEWIAGRYTEWSKYSDTDCYHRGGLFVDQYTREYSRDCEPMRGGHTDNYYYQLASWVRRFKGVREPAAASGSSRIGIDGSFDDWLEVAPEFRDTIGDTAHRDHVGYGDLRHRNTTGRNDFVRLKAAYDGTALYFFAQTREPITPRTDRNWMLLLLDTDQDVRTGWLGYDYVVNLEVFDDSESSIKAWRQGVWQDVGRAQYRVNRNGLELSIGREVVGLVEGEPAFDFHWADNIQGFGDVSELGVNGDSAPNRRWNYRFEVRK